ncbi:D-alanine--D-alanine ligase [Agrococcus sp. ARC_14]|uniref:D-alanine--D-alanine ligase family protein n=1 Tax=Agrococcus sp. ARC_14 TaxID=2919927 RepID=UPI001F0542AD|nr:D-alanine--D-alanine ligase [Agrococcus sp. ARC_14]MCH1884410.1 D-alanine--D-alanine ligase [Agrococcus sp. ARC_14]
MTTPTQILVIGGGQSAEHEVSLESAASVEAALRRRGYAVESITIGRDGRWQRGDAERDDTAPGGRVVDTLAAALPAIARADVVFPAVHGALGEDGTLAALCALAHTPIVGSGVRAGAIGMDKWATKLVAEAVGIRTAPGRLVHARALAAVAFDGDAVVKPVGGGSSHGVALVRDAIGLDAALRAAALHDDRILLEQPVVGREIDVAVLREADGSRWAAPPLEIHADGLFDTATKYDGSARFSVPAVVSETERAAVTEAALRMFDALDCAGVARVDFFLTDDGPVLNEINTMPGMTAASQVPRMFAAAGVPYDELLARLVDAAAVPVRDRRCAPATPTPGGAG